jgi:hypothetical protein
MTDSPGTLVPAGLAEAKGDQVVRPKLAHVAERHRRAGWVVGFYSITLVAAGASVFLNLVSPAIVPIDNCS